jgi:hypothetical protein
VRAGHGAIGRGVEGGEDGVLVLGQRGLVGRAAAERGDARRDDQRVRGADRRAEVGGVLQDEGGHGERARPQAVDRRDVRLEGQRHELGVVGVAGELEREEAVAGAGGRRGLGAGGLDERAG